MGWSSLQEVESSSHKTSGQTQNLDIESEGRSICMAGIVRQSYFVQQFFVFNVSCYFSWWFSPLSDGVRDETTHEVAQMRIRHQEELTELHKKRGEVSVCVEQKATQLPHLAELPCLLLLLSPVVEYLAYL